MGWLKWESLGGQLIGAPAAFSFIPFANKKEVNLDVFVRGTDNQLWQRAWRTNHWKNWARPDNESFLLGSSPMVTSTVRDFTVPKTGKIEGDLHIFARGTDGQLWHKVWISDKAAHKLNQYTHLFSLKADPIWEGV